MAALFLPPIGNVETCERGCPESMIHKKNPCLPRLCSLVAIAIVLASPASAEWNEKVLHSFQGGANAGSVPVGGVVFDKQGNLYGVTSDGGGVYQLKPPAQKGGAWSESVLYVFQGNSKGDGATPEGGLVIDSAGNLYGTTAYGGTGNCVLLGNSVGCGTVYELSPPAQKGGAWTETILYSFPTAKQGYFPWGDLVFDGAGNLYGATAFGGSKGTTCDKFYGGQCGVVFELSPPKTKGGSWAQKVLHNFAGVAQGKQYGDGANPNGGLVLDSKGNLYGTTVFGGNESGGCAPAGCGTVFEFTPPIQKGGAWIETVLHRFMGSPDGGGPAAGVAFDAKGRLYCTTVGGGGGNFPSGTVVQFVPHSNGTWTEHVLHSFQDNGDGSQPRSRLIFDSLGTLYGTATGGGTDFAGTLFRLKRNPTGGWMFTVLYTFTGVNNGDGAYPSGGILINASNIFGTTEVGGMGQECQGGCGTVFEVSP